jgi:hypothetical protein
MFKPCFCLHHPGRMESCCGGLFIGFAVDGLAESSSSLNSFDIMKKAERDCLSEYGVEKEPLLYLLSRKAAAK